MNQKKINRQHFFSKIFKEKWGGLYFRLTYTEIQRGNTRKIGYRSTELVFTPDRQCLPCFIRDTVNKEGTVPSHQQNTETETSINCPHSEMNITSEPFD